jgi:uncharacterized protein YjbI with pentapeptide repeats
LAGGLLLAFLLAGTAAPSAPAGDCRDLLGSIQQPLDPALLEEAVDGDALAGPEALLALRAARPDGPLLVRGGRFAGADLRGAALDRICFVGTDLSGADLGDAAGAGMAFVEAHLSGARLAGARMPGVLLRSVRLDNADARGADWSGGSFESGWFDADLTDLRLDGARLAGFRFDCGLTVHDGCPLDQDGISMRGADLSGAWLAIRPSDLAGARIDGTRTPLAGIGAFAAADLAGPLLVDGPDAPVALAPDEVRQLLLHLRPPTAGEGDAAPLLADPQAPPDWAVPGATALFLDGLDRFDPAFFASPLFPRLVPALVAASGSSLAVRVAADGTLSAVGHALAANAHSCSVAGDGLAFDPATGWYAGPQPPEPDDPPERAGTPMRVLRFVGETGRIFQNGHGAPPGDPDGDPRISLYAGCGARAYFQPMRRLPIPAAEAEAWFRALSATELPEP